MLPDMSQLGLSPAPVETGTRPPAGKKKMPNRLARSPSIERPDYSNIFWKDDDGRTLLHYAVMDNNVEKVKDLLRRDIDKESTIFKGSTALHLAAVSPERLAVVRVLVEGGANVLAKDGKGRTALHLAAASARGQDKGLEMVKLLAEAMLASGSDVSGEDNEGETALHKAVQHPDNLAVVQALIEYGANVFANGNHTPFWWAMWQANRDYEPEVKAKYEAIAREIEQYEDLYRGGRLPPQAY